MNKQELIKMAADFVLTSEDNYVKKELALSADLEGMKIFEEPIFAFGRAEDEYFNKLKNEDVIGNHFKLPKEWLLQGKTVISYFLPYTETVRKSNSKEKVWPSKEWLHGRYEGQILLNGLSEYLKKSLIDAGYPSVAPSLAKDFWASTKSNENSASQDEKDLPSFTSNWSERHVALVCGLGTFGLSKGLITAKGMAGRIGSIVTELEINTLERDYHSIDEYCTKCGACIKQCPVDAISFAEGKKHPICGKFVDTTEIKYNPRYGCGKCQVSVPCESRIPSK